MNKAETIESICCGQPIHLQPGDSRELSISPDQLQKLLLEEWLSRESAYNCQPRLQDFLELASKVHPFLEDDIDLRFYFKGNLHRSLERNDEEVRLEITAFKLCNSDEAMAISDRIEILPIVSQFITKHRADEFQLTDTLFYAWWD